MKININAVLFVIVISVLLYGLVNLTTEKPESETNTDGRTSDDTILRRPSGVVSFPSPPVEGKALSLIWENETAKIFWMYTANSNVEITNIKFRIISDKIVKAETNFDEPIIILNAGETYNITYTFNNTTKPQDQNAVIEAKITVIERDNTDQYSLTWRYI